jgi:hypothetical protein
LGDFNCDEVGVEGAEVDSMVESVYSRGEVVIKMPNGGKGPVFELGDDL